MEFRPRMKASPGGHDPKIQVSLNFAAFFYTIIRLLSFWEVSEGSC